MPSGEQRTAHSIAPMDLPNFPQRHGWAMGHAFLALGRNAEAVGHFRVSLSAGTVPSAEDLAWLAIAETGALPPDTVTPVMPDFTIMRWVARILAWRNHGQPERWRALLPVLRETIRRTESMAFAAAICGLLGDLGQMTEYEEAIADMLARWPDSADAAGWAAGLLGQTGSLDRGLMQARRAYALAPEQADSIQALVFCLIPLGQLDEAEALIHKGLALDPDFTPLVMSAGKLALIRNRPDEARAHFERTVAHGDSSGRNLTWVGMAAWRQGHLDEALTVQAEAVSLLGRESWIHSNLAICLAAAGRRDEAVAAQQRAMAAEPWAMSYHDLIRPYARDILADLSAAAARSSESGKHEERATPTRAISWT